MFGLSEWTTNSVLRTISHVFDHLKTFIFLKCSFIWWENYLGLRQSGKSICLSWERTRVGRQWEGRIQILLPTTVCVSVSRHTHNSHIIKEKTVRWITFEFFYSQLSERADVPPQEITAGEDDGRLRKKKKTCYSSCHTSGITQAGVEAVKRLVEGVLYTCVCVWDGSVRVKPALRLLCCNESLAEGWGGGVEERSRRKG